MTVEPWHVHEEKTQVEQVGGAHYQAQVQHWDLMEQYDVGYLEATATKYVAGSRWRSKGGLEDLRKAVTYLRKMDGRRARRRVPLAALAAYYAANPGMGQQEQLVTTLVVGEGHGHPWEVDGAILVLEQMIAAGA